MLDANNIVEMIKKASQDAANAIQDCDFCYGTVTSASPLKILVEQKMELTAAQLVLARNVTDYSTSATLENIGTVQMNVRNALQKGDKVVLLRKKGGQEYLALDRVVRA